MSNGFEKVMFYERRKRMAKDLKRLNMNMPAGLMEQLDLYAEKMNVNRSAAVNMLISMALEQRNMVDVAERMIIELQDVKAKGLLK